MHYHDVWYYLNEHQLNLIVQRIQEVLYQETPIVKPCRFSSKRDKTYIIFTPDKHTPINSLFDEYISDLFGKDKEGLFDWVNLMQSYTNDWSCSAQLLKVGPLH